MQKFFQRITTFNLNPTTHSVKNDQGKFSGSSAKCSETPPPKRVFNELNKQEQVSYLIHASAAHIEDLQQGIMHRIALAPNSNKRALLEELQQILDSSKAKYTNLSGEIEQFNCNKELYLKLNAFLIKVNYVVED